MKMRHHICKYGHANSFIHSFCMHTHTTCEYLQKIPVGTFGRSGVILLMVLCKWVSWHQI